MNFKLERKLKPKNDKMASEIIETAKVAAFRDHIFNYGDIVWGSVYPDDCCVHRGRSWPYVLKPQIRLQFLQRCRSIDRMDNIHFLCSGIAEVCQRSQ